MSRAWTAGALVMTAAVLLVPTLPAVHAGAVGPSAMASVATAGSGPTEGDETAVSATPAGSGRMLAAVTPGTASIIAPAGGSAEGTPVSSGGARSTQGVAADLAFDGYRWTVKSSTTPIGPGPNLLDSSGPYVDRSRNVELRILKTTVGWESSEVVLSRSLGYGSYTWCLRGPVATFDPNVVLALFTYDTANTTPSNREIDFEASRFANADNTTNAQYVVQPYTTVGNLRRISIPTAAITKVTLRWTPGRVAYSGQTVRGGKTEPIRSWSNTSSSVPDHGGEQVHMSLWLFRGAPPSNGKPVAVTVTDFAFSPVT